MFTRGIWSFGRAGLSLRIRFHFRLGGTQTAEMDNNEMLWACLRGRGRGRGTWEPGQALVSFHCPVALTGSPELASRVCPISETQPPVSAPPRGQSLRGFLLLLLHRGLWRKAPERVTSVCRWKLPSLRTLAEDRRSTE